VAAALLGCLNMLGLPQGSCILYFVHYMRGAADGSIIYSSFLLVLYLLVEALSSLRSF
jgi:hypothetical protein